MANERYTYKTQLNIYVASNVQKTNMKRSIHKHYEVYQKQR